MKSLVPRLLTLEMRMMSLKRKRHLSFLLQGLVLVVTMSSLIRVRAAATKSL